MTDFREICYLLMIHDFIIEMGYKGAPPKESEFYGRVAALPHISSIVSASESTTRDLFKWYGNLVQPNFFNLGQIGVSQ